MRNFFNGLFNVIIFGNYWWRPHNLFRVDEQLTRSAQPPPEYLRRLIRASDIKTVINLRGESSAKEWYKGEKEICDSEGVCLRNIKLSAVRLPRREEIQNIVNTIRSSEYPIHVHCRGGAERTGLFCGVYQLLGGQGLDKALEQVGWRYGVINPFQRDFFKRFRESRERGFIEWMTEK